ncbi:MAG: hypothetical protein J2P58_00820, partial [Acidimicrobiaceae bacterium]|nr:hypothetical protein [Acidimicrobiaceae bacterium]
MNDQEHRQGKPLESAVLASGQDALEAVGALAPLLRERGGETESLRRLPDATVADLRDSGLVGIMTPKRW